MATKIAIILSIVSVSVNVTLIQMLTDLQWRVYLLELGQAAIETLLGYPLG